MKRCLCDFVKLLPVIMAAACVVFFVWITGDRHVRDEHTALTIAGIIAMPIFTAVGIAWSVKLFNKP